MTTRKTGGQAAACAPPAPRLPRPYRRRLALILARRAAARRARTVELRAHLERRRADRAARQEGGQA